MAKCVGDCIGEANWRAVLVAFGNSLCAEPGEWRRRLHGMQKIEFRHLGGGGHEIVGESPGEKTAVLRVGKFFIDRSADRRGEGAAYLADPG